MNYDYNKNVQLFQFQSGYRNFHLNSLKGYGQKIITGQTGTVITLCFRTPSVFGQPLFLIEIIIFYMHKNMFFGHPLFSDTPIFHRNNYFSVSENIG